VARVQEPRSKNDKKMLVVEPDHLLDSEVLAFNCVYTP
jgi:hypothetical protein